MPSVAAARRSPFRVMYPCELRGGPCSLAALVAIVVFATVPAYGQQSASDNDPGLEPGWQLMILDAVQLHVPADWVVFDERTTSETLAEMQREFETLRNIDMGTIQAMASSPVPDDFAENVNVSPMPLVAEINSVEMNEYMEAIAQQVDGTGYEIQFLSNRIDRVAGIECYVLEMHSRFQNADIYQLHYAVPGVDATYAITYTCGLRDRYQFQSLFVQSINTLRITGREYNPIERVIPAASGIQENAMLYGVLAAVAGLAIALIVLGLKRD